MHKLKLNVKHAQLIVKPIWKNGERKRQRMLNEYYPLIPLLDHGYLRYVEHWGKGDAGQDEAAIIEAARMSTNKGFNGWDAVECPECKIILSGPQHHTSAPGVFCPNNSKFDDIGDKKLLAFLYNKKHNGPFEFAGMTIELAAPIFIFREWHRHRTQSYNELSGRYVPLPHEDYLPSVERILLSKQITANKQAQSTSSFEMTEQTIREDRMRLIGVYDHIQEIYEHLLERGWSKELARLPVPVARYSRMRATGNLRNWLAFLTLRMDSAAQWEIRQYANAVGEIIKQRFPRTWKLFALERGYV